MTILGYLRVKPIDRIILETHYLTVSDEVLDFIVKQLSGKRIAIEMGLESGNQMVLDNILQKKIDLVDLSKVMQKIKSYGIDIILNVFLGIPGFTPKQQVEDAKMAIQWAYAHGADEVVIFPANIKPGTRLWKLYEQGFYQPISHWMLIELLNNLDDQQLNTVGVSWYGDRQAAGIDTDIISPVACNVCHLQLMDFYQAFMSSYDCVVRKELLKNLRNNVKCGCYDKLLNELRG